ncbi:uncharacterized protein LOC128305717 [Anopheles moucheti]|uniref:uncharacterized protein LOC128305717 n=1 Tax=Anopheles moucheti TaxID=186751 RepID=UPI0022F0644C|nr:uncharacterized protein LOC128305717 [Anopheles moucheti]
MESSKVATVPPTTTVANASGTTTTTTGTPPATVSSDETVTPVTSTPEHDKVIPTAVTTDCTAADDTEPKIEQVTPADMEPQSPPNPVDMQELVDPLAVSEETPEISTTSNEPEQPLEGLASTIKGTEPTVEEDSLAGASNSEATSEQVLKPTTSAQPAVANDDSKPVDKSAEVSESTPTSTSSPSGNPSMDSSSTVEETKGSNRVSPARTPPPVVESSTASPEKSVTVAADDSSAPLDGPIQITTSTVDSSSSGDKTEDKIVETVEGSSSNSSDNVNSINNDCSSSSSIRHSKEAESHMPARENGSTSLNPNTTTTDPSDRTRSLSTEVVPPLTVEVAMNAVIEKETSASSVDSTPSGPVILRQEADKDEKQPPESLTRPDESQERLDENKALENHAETNDAILNRPNRESGCDPPVDQRSNETLSVESSANKVNGQEKREANLLEHRESSAVPPEPDPGPPVEEQFRLVDSKSAESCKNLKENDTTKSVTSGEAQYNTVQTTKNMEAESSQNEMINGSNNSRTMNTLSTGLASRSDYHQQQQTPPVSARNPLQFTEVANDEVELKVDGGHLLDRVIKLSLLKGLQDSGKRLAKSSLIISGAGASIGEGGNSEATLATTSSLSKAKSAAAGLRLMEEHKTTPPALVANGGVSGNVEGAQVAVTEIASSTKEIADSPNCPTVQSGGRIRHSSDTTVSSSPSGELDAGVRSSSNSSLDFREEERSPTVQVQETASPVSSLEASSSRSCSAREPVAAVVPHNNEHLPMKARKPQYYASIPDFSKQQFSSAAPLPTVSTSTTTAAKSLAQLHMKTPDFSRLVCDTVPSSQTSPSSTTTNSALSTITSTNTRTTSELKISNPDFTKGFATQNSHYSSVQGNNQHAHDQQQPENPASSSPYVTQDTFSKLIKERNYIADLQLKNPPPTQNQGSSDAPTVVKGAGLQNDYPPSRVVVVDTTSTTSGGPATYGHGASTPINQYRRTSSIENGMEPEPKAHVIHKNAESSSAQPPPASQPVGVYHAPKTWNPPEFSSKHFTQSSASNSRPGGTNGAGPSSTSPSSRDPSPAPSSSSPHQPSYGQHPGGLVNYTGKSPHAVPTSVAGTERIIVNNVRTYYPEASVPPASASLPHSGTVSQTPASYPSLPKVKDPEFRLDQNREQLLLQEGTIVTVKQAHSNHSTGRGQLPPPTTTRSPSAERREAQMMQNSQDILYRDYKQHKKPTSSVGPVTSNSRPAGPSQSPIDRRSPYDPAAYYAQTMNHHRPPVIPPQGGGLMHPPPPNWPGPGQHLPSHQMLRGAVGPGARTSPPGNGASPVSSPAPPPNSQHHYHHPPHPHQAPYYGQYKNAPSPASGSTYGTNSSPAQPQGTGGKYPPQQPYPSGTGASDRRHEVLERGVGSGNYKGLDYNMEQKFAEVYQAHQAKEKQAAAEAAASSSVRHGSRPVPGTASGSPGISSTPGTSSKGPAPYSSAGYEQYHPYYQHSQATPSPTSTPSPVPSPHHRKYSGPPSRDPSPLGQQPQQQHLHNRYGSSETSYHLASGGPSAMYAHPVAPKPNEQGTSQQPMPPASYYQNQPSSSSSSYSSATATYSSRPHNSHGAVMSPHHANPAQQSVISGNPYDRYVHPYATSGSSQPVPGGQQQQQTHHSKSSLPYPAAGRLQGPPPLQPTPVPVVVQSPVIHPPLTGSKNIPVRVIATAPPAAASSTNAASLPTTVPPVQPQGTPRSLAQSNASSSSVVVASSQPVLASAGEENGSQREMNTVAATTPVIIAPAKRESPLDLSVKTVKTKADSTGCDDYTMSASNSSISSSSSSSSNGGSGRPREVVPKVDFSPNFQKHIPPRNPGSSGASGVNPPAADVRQPEPQNQPIPSPTRHVSVISPAIPPGYDKKTDAYMSANYRAVGGPLVSPAYQYPGASTRLGPGPVGGGYDGSPATAPASSSSMGSASSKSVYYPPTGLEYGRPAGKSGSGSIVTGQAATAPGATNARSNSSSQGTPSTGHSSHSQAVSAQPRLDDPRIEDRKFVESMLKKKTSPSSDVMADLQAGKFPTRIPQNMVPKKRAAAAAAAVAAAEAAMTKVPVIQPGVSSPTVPTPAKVAKYEDPTATRGQGGPAQVPLQGHPQMSPQGAPILDGRYPNHSQGPPPREAAYANYAHGASQAGIHYTSSSKRASTPEMPNGPTVHPSVITTNYHHHPPAVLQQQYATDARYYQHHPSAPVKSRDDHIIPVYHQPHLRGGNAVSYAPHTYGYSKDEPNVHSPYPQHHSESMMYQKVPPGAPPFRYGDSLKAPPEHTTVHHMQSHIHYTGGNVGAVPKVGLGASHQYQHQQHPQSQNHSPQSAAETMAVSQYSANVHPNYGPPQHHRGADQSVISKLRTSLELKEYEKQRINQLRKQPGMELGDEDRVQKAAMPPASPVATSIMPSLHDAPSPSSRFRTKGELKGYTPLPIPSVVTKPHRSINESPPLSLKREERAGEEAKADDEETKQSIVPPLDMDGASALDILDWGSTCNEFVEQLQTGKKRGRRKRTAAVTLTAAGSVGGRSWPAIDSIETTIPVADGSTTDLSAIPKEVLNSARSPHRLKGARDGSESSSDEDKPLLLLRQQSQQQQKDHEQGQVDGKAHVEMVQTEKAARNHREKQRLELQQKHEAKLGRSSSTDSETARVASAAAQRAKARVRKLRHRSSVVPALSLKSSDGDGDVTADGGEDEGGKQAQKRVPHSLANSAKRKRIRGPASRSSSASSSSSSESNAPALKKPENEMPRKRGRPKGTGAGVKRGQQSTHSRCQTGTIKQEPNENSDLSSDEESRAIRTPHKNGSGTAGNSDSAKKREGGAAVSNTGGSSGSGNGAGGKAQHGSKVNEGSTCNDEQKDKITSVGAKKKLTKARTNSRSKADSSSASSSASTSSSEEEEEEAEETMTRSRSKREAERRRSNSKVLRNDKIVENCPNPSQSQRVNARNRADSERTPTKKTKARKLAIGEPTPKRSKSRVVDSDSDGSKAGVGNAVPRKRTRQASKNAPNSSAGSGESADSSSENDGRMDLSERLRSRKVAKRATDEPGRKQPTSTSMKSGSRRESTTSAKGSESSSKKKGNSAGPSSTSALAGVKKSLKELNQTEPPDHFYPGWEKELYEYKRSLKVPPELITIDGGLYMHRISTSLPDLDSPHHSDGSETFTEIRKKLNQREVGSVPPKRFKTKAAAKQQQQQPQPGTSSSSGTVIVKEEEHNRQERKKIDDDKKFRSIIELLHRRCIAAQGAKPMPTSSSSRGKGAKSASKGTSSSTVNNEAAKPKQEFELLPTPGAESESLFSKNSKKKKSLFDTAILKSRTRTEQKAMQSKEMIREVFGGDDERPQSAPPLSCGTAKAPLFEEGLQNVTFDERYNELMRNHDRIVDELDGGAAAAAVKQEPLEDEDDEEEEEAEDEEEDDDTQDGSVRMKDSERDTPSIASERGERDLPGTPLSFHGGAAILNANVSASTSGQLTVPAAPKKRGRGHRTSRRKGSSGFDYIRKKKKPSQQQHHGSHQHQHGASGGNGLNCAIGVRKVTAFENMEGKDETHISKEIRSWVLNKGVGESVMHKAARLGYTDVIVYCLERLDMDPDLKDNAGYTPLHEACAKGHLDIANYLLQYGASHSEPAPSGMRPLHEAVENSFLEIVRLLLAFGADPMLATYAGMTPMQLSESDDMTRFLEHHLSDVQSMAPNKIGWKFDGPWKIHDPEESGCNIFSGIPGFEESDGLTSLNSSGTSSGAISSASSKRCDSNSNIMHYEVGESVTSNSSVGTCESTRKRNGICTENPPVGLRNGKIKRELPSQEVRPANGVVPRTMLFNGGDRTDAEQQDLDLHDAGSDDGEDDEEVIFEYEEADQHHSLPPLYELKDEYNERWILMNDLCSFLKYKSKEAVLRQICPNNSANSHRELIREMKFEEFLTRASCLQLLCAGEKLKMTSSKVVLVKYNDSVKSLLQVQSFITRI